MRRPARTLAGPATPTTHGRDRATMHADIHLLPHRTTAAEAHRKAVAA
ncbi:hypothetical protein ACF1BN_04155 [Streptomyces sp. NPDC014861]